MRHGGWVILGIWTLPQVASWWVESTATQLTVYKYAMPVWVTWQNVSLREDGFPEGGARGKTILPRGDIPSCYPHWHGIFDLLYRTNPVCNCKQSKVTDDWWFTHSPLGVASGNGQHEALTDGIRQHDDCSLLSQPITAYDLKVRYNNINYNSPCLTLIQNVITVSCLSVIVSPTQDRHLVDLLML